MKRAIKTELLQARITPKCKEVFGGAAKLRGISMSTWAVETCREAAVKQYADFGLGNPFLGGEWDDPLNTIRAIENLPKGLDWSSGKPPDSAGVYLFVAHGEILYVGQSKKLATRIASHHNMIWFRLALSLLGEDKVQCHWAITERTIGIEKRLITEYQPKLNRAHREAIAPAYSRTQKPAAKERRIAEKEATAEARKQERHRLINKKSMEALERRKERNRLGVEQFRNDIAALSPFQRAIYDRISESGRSNRLSPVDNCRFASGIFQWKLGGKGCWGWARSTLPSSKLGSFSDAREALSVLAPDGHGIISGKTTCGNKKCINPAHFELLDSIPPL